MTAEDIASMNVWTDLRSGSELELFLTGRNIFCPKYVKYETASCEILAEERIVYFYDTWSRTGYCT